MDTQIHNSTEPGATALMGGIIDDVQHLVKQQIALTRQEIVDDIAKAREATKLYVVGYGVFCLGGLLLSLAAVHLLHWATSPAGTDIAALPLWACHAAVGAVLLLIGVAVIWCGEGKWNSINPLHNAATDELKKSVEWGLHPK